jgi:uncharacterized protein with PIN domain
LDGAKGPSSREAQGKRRGSKPACAGLDGAKGPSSREAQGKRRGSKPACAGLDGAKGPSSARAGGERRADDRGRDVMAHVHIRFDTALDVFLPPPLRGVEFAYDAAQGATAKHAIEALGVPHTEVGALHVDGRPAPLDHRLRDGEHLHVDAVVPATTPADDPRFVADAHLARLARYLRFLGFDTLQRNAWDDGALVAIARADRRVVLTRDRALLMRRNVEHGCCVRATEPLAQLREVCLRFGLRERAGRAPRCLLCNAVLEPLHAAPPDASLPPAVRARHDAFWRCPSCRRLYWRGSQWQRLRERVQAACAAPPAAPGPA